MGKRFPSTTTLSGIFRGQCCPHSWNTCSSAFRVRANIHSSLSLEPPSFSWGKAWKSSRLTLLCSLILSQGKSPANSKQSWKDSSTSSSNPYSPTRALCLISLVFMLLFANCKRCTPRVPCFSVLEAEGGSSPSFCQKWGRVMKESNTFFPYSLQTNAFYSLVIFLSWV